MAALLFSVELFIHAKCGFDVELFEMEEKCLEFGTWATLLAISEAFCQSGMAVAMTGGLWEVGLAISECNLNQHIKDSVKGSLGINVIAVMSFVFVSGIRLWGLVDEDNFPYWASALSHVMEFLCATIIWTCLVGLFCDFVTCFCHSKAKGAEFLFKFALCDDELESHGLVDTSDHQYDYDREGDFKKAVVMWMVFLFVLMGNIHLNLYDDGLHVWMGHFLEVLGAICSGGIAKSVVTSLATLSCHDLAESTPNTTIANLTSRHSTKARLTKAGMRVNVTGITAHSNIHSHISGISAHSNVHSHMTELSTRYW